MANLLPQCVKCGSPVTDSLEDEIEQHEKIKAGSYIKGVWTCNDCIIASSQAQKDEEDEQQDTIGVTSKSDVSPNTPRADEAGL
jgi:Zn-finger protein